MQGQEFENNVHKEMEELRVSPSGEVWHRVENELRKDKRRRRLLLLWPLFLLIGLGGYWWIQHGGQTTVIADEKLKTADSITAPEQQVAIVPQATHGNQNPAAPENAKSQVDNVTGISSKSSVHSQPHTIAEKKPSTNAAASSLPNRDKRKTSNKPVMVLSGSVVANKKLKKGTVNDKTILSKEQAGKESTSEVAVSPRKEDSIPTIVLIPAQKGTDSANIVKASEIPNTTDTAPATKIVPGNKSKWQWGISSNLGIAKLSKGGILNSFNNSQVMDAAYSNSSSSPVSNSPGYIEPATVKPGVNLSAGFFAQKKLANRISISLGMQYNYFSTKNSIGTRVDSSLLINNISSNSVRVSDFYLNGGTENFTSKYHFLELPVTMYFQLTRNQKFPFYGSFGLSVGQLIAVDALQYDGSTGIYYKDNSLFRKTQFGMHTGLSMQFFHGHLHPLELGPQFQYKFSNLLTNTNNDSRHLLSGSLLFRWYF